MSDFAGGELVIKLLGCLIVILSVWDRNYFLLGDISSFYYYPFGTNMSATPFLYDFDTLSNLEQDFLKKLVVKSGPYFQYK